MTEIMDLRTEQHQQGMAFSAVAGEVAMEWFEAFQKHEGHTPADPTMENAERMVILIEEIGEVARAQTYDEGNVTQLRKELIQVAAMAIAWVAGMDRTAG